MGQELDAGVWNALGPAARERIEALELAPHPEGGWYRETWRSESVIAQAGLPAEFAGDRRAVTSILFLLPTGTRSRWHRVRSDELWLHHQGDDIRLAVTPNRPTDGSGPQEVRLGQGAGARLQGFVPGGAWQEAEALAGPTGYALVGCVVAPGFEFDDFEMIDSPV